METTGLFTKMYFYTFILLFDTSSIKIFTLSIHIISFYGFIFLDHFKKKKLLYISPFFCTLLVHYYYHL